MFPGRRFDDVTTLCDRARLTCRVVPGDAETPHRGLDDPTAAAGSADGRAAAFDRVLTEISGRVRRFVPLTLAQAAR
jgi:hypothetical protein